MPATVPAIDAVVQPSHDDCVYAAGLFDGEGSIHIASLNGGYCYQPRLSIAQKDARVLVWVRERWGGAIYINDTSRVGRWDVGKLGRILTFIKDIEPYLKVKDRQVRYLLGLPGPPYKEIHRTRLNGMHKVAEEDLWETLIAMTR